MPSQIPREITLNYVRENMAVSFSFQSLSRRIVNSVVISGQNKVPLTWCRNLMLSKLLRQDGEQSVAEEDAHVSKKRKIVDVETSIRYLNSKAFEKGYGEKPVWFHYRRNFKGNKMPPTRKQCVRAGEIATSSPCPVCRDEHLVLDAKNTKLLEHFISPYTGEIYNSMKTGLCQQQQRKLTVQVMKAYDQGFLEMKVPVRTYNYDDYKS